MVRSTCGRTGLLASGWESMSDFTQRRLHEFIDVTLRGTGKSEVWFDWDVLHHAYLEDVPTRSELAILQIASVGSFARPVDEYLSFRGHLNIAARRHDARLSFHHAGGANLVCFDRETSSGKGMAMGKLADYVMAFAIRGPCTCGRCIDAPADAKDLQPAGHTVDLTFFKVASKPGASAEVFERLARSEFPGWFDHREHNYLEMGAAMGDQGLALMTIGLGHVLGVWRALSPETLLSGLPPDLKMQLAGGGFVAMNVASKKEVVKVLSKGA